MVRIRYSYLKFLFVLLIFAFAQNASGQLQATWWYFGNNGGCAFTSSPPVPAPGGQVSTIEGEATISDASGNLLFYTDGIRVWNRNHVQMPNGFGLMGNPSSSQSGVIVQKPGSNNIYYVFTADAQAGLGGIRYSEVDMTLQVGFGDVTANKNILLYTPATEKICAVRHCNNTDVWVITHRWNSNQFSAYLVTAAGVNTTPVNSNSGQVNSGSTTNTIGYLKVSPDGSKLAMAVRYQTSGSQPGYVELFDFNNQTGVVSNGFSLGSVQYAYGVEFSPNSQLLYVARSQSIAIYQYNVCAGTQSQIIASQVQVGTSTVGWAGSLQLAPDGKIYHARYLSNTIGVINSPNTIGVGCNWIDIGPTIAGTSQLGLPNFVGTYFRIPPTITSAVNTQVNCLLANFTFTSQMQNTCNNPNNTITSVFWNFGDPNSGPNDTSSLQNPSHTFTTGGTYTVTLIVNYNCYADTVTYPVTLQNCGPTVTMSNVSVCQNNCTTLVANASGGTAPYTYSWNPNVGTASSVTVCPTATTTYTVVITDSTNQTSQTTATVTVNNPPTVAISSTAIMCNGGTSSATATLSGGTSPFTYSWNPTGQTTSTATGLSAGTYTVTITDASGCTSIATVTITQPTALSASVSTTSAICSAANGSASVSASGGIGPYTYLWSPGGQTTATATGLSSGTYSVLITDANGCTYNSSAVVNGISGGTASIQSSNNVSCYGGNNGSATAIITGGTSPFTYSWNPTGQTTSTATGLSAGTYIVTITDAYGCTSTTTVSITQPAVLSATTTTTADMCSASNGTASVFASGGTGIYTYLWTPGGQTNTTVTGLSAGNYSVTVTDANGCSHDTMVVVNFTPGPTANAGADVSICPWSNTTLNASGGVNYFWTPASGLSNTAVSNPVASPSSTTTYTVVVTDANNCTASDDVTVFVNPQPVASFTTSDVCLNSITTFNNTSTNSTSWGWNFGDNTTSTLQNSTHTYLAWGTYIVTLVASSGNGCQDTVSDTVTVFPLPIVSFAGDTVCLENNTSFADLSFIPSGSITGWNWNFGDPASGSNNTSSLQNPVHQFTSAGNFTVTLTLTSNNGCTNSSSLSVLVYPIPAAGFSISPDSTLGLSEVASFTDLSTGGVVQWLWQFGDGDTSSTQNPTHLYSDTGTYIITLIVISNNGCRDSIQYPIKIADYAFYIPNAFSPNDDNINDFFFGKGIGIVEYELSIFDRWGNRIFYCQINDPETSSGQALPQSKPCQWNGNVYGSDNLVQEDVYIWQVNLKNVFSKRFTYTGHVTVVR